MPGLKNSRWALRDAHGICDNRDVRSSSVPAPSNRTHAAAISKSTKNLAHSGQGHTSAGSSAAELSRYSKIVRRMKWKLPFLDQAYRQAVSDNGIDTASRSEAELMFKLDFFEYYMLCERALVHLQGVFGVTISRDSTSSVPVVSAGGRRGKHTHRYHANVLEALDRKDHPLHEILGVGDVRWQLARAKDLRNRWKNADDDVVNETVGYYNRKYKPPPLATYDLARILLSIHEGLDRSYVAATDFVAAIANKSCPAGAEAAVSAMDTALGEAEEDQWGFMVEAMDWEAI